MQLKQIQFRISCGGHLFLCASIATLIFSIMPASRPAAAQAAAPTDAAQAPDPVWLKNLANWRAQREAEISAPDGWLTLAGLDWLKPGINSVGVAADNQIQIHAQAPDHIGLFTVSGKTALSEPVVQLLSPKGGFPPGLTIDGKPAREGPLVVDGPQTSRIAWHGLTLTVLNRGGRFALRSKDADSPNRTAFHGLNWYPPNPHFRVEALWIPYTPPHTEKIPTAIGTTLDMPAPGVAEFTLDDTTYRLEPVLEDPADKSLFFILRDETSKTTTYEAARYLHTALPTNGLAKEGLLVLDFNRLENPPCAYTPYATCPLPPEKNRLPIALEAGEKRYGH
jgi:uncharacterized protein (DUF1684 family)